jgi:hypothetical protein
MFGRRASVVQEAPSSPSPPRPVPLRVLRADGQRIDLSSRDTGPLLAATRQSWQPIAWSYRDLIGELRYAIRLLSRSVARVRFYVAETRPWPDDPAPLDGDEHELDKQLAADALHNFARLPMDDNPDGFTARLVENLSVAGEGWVHLDTEGRFHVRSTSEITVTADGAVVLTTLPTSITGGRRAIDPTSEDLLRCWVPHPEWGQLADSPMRCLLDVAEDVVLAGREQRAAARSRVAANGILLMPSTLSLVRSRAEDDEDDDSVTSDTFMADFTAAMLASIRDDGDAQAVVPIVIRGDAEDLDKVRHLTLQRADSEQLIGRQNTAILRLLKGLDVQPEQVEGVGGMNHWGAWIIDSRSIRDQVQPMAETVAACLAQAFLRPALLSLDHDPDQVARITIEADVTELAENPNRGQDARDAHRALTISDAAFRVALGFEDDDAPDQDEMLRRAALDGKIPVELVSDALGLAKAQSSDGGSSGSGSTDSDETGKARQDGEEDRDSNRCDQIAESTGKRCERPAVEGGTSCSQHGGKVRPGDGDKQKGQSAPSARSPADRGTPEQPDLSRGPGVVASANGHPTIDPALVDRITVAADAAIARLVERAGARLRSAAQKDRALTAALAGVESCRIPARLGRDRVEEFVPVADLLALSDGYPRLRGQLSRWLPDATSDEVWQGLVKQINTAAERAMFTARASENGELLIQPDAVRSVLALSREDAI